MEQVLENATSLAWIGDAQWSLAVRKHLLARGFRRPSDLQWLSSKYCSAKGQASMLEALKSSGILNEDEMEIVRRGRNASIHSKAKNADIETYRKATAFEALIGYLSLYHHEERLDQLIDLSLQTGDTL